MGHIMKRKKKGRPSKADIARRAATAESPATVPPEKDLRRSLRRRNVIYHIDYDDYIDEDDEEDERREKKLKLLLKLQAKEGSAESAPIRNRRVGHAPADSAHSSDQGEGEKSLSKSKIAGDGEIESGVDEGGSDDKVTGRKMESRGTDSVPAAPVNLPLGVPLPDKKSLELILDKLQKKDKYGVYAEPVDPEELPDYHDVIKHPMDFATVRKKLGDGSYSNLEQLESDVFLICTNAMRYNTPDTIYYKQACAIQELATKKFQKLRTESERSCKELKSEQTERANFLTKKQLKKTMNQTMEESVGSGFSKGMAPATTGDFLNGSNGTQFSGGENPINADVPVERNALLVQNMDKAEDLLLGKGLLSKFARKAFVHDENPRGTYNLSNQPDVFSDSIFTTFDGEIKQLVVVGLHTDHSYARSLARFAATLGPVAWKVASKKIEQSLPPGFKFGHGWVGEYEPLPTPVLMLDDYHQKEPAFPTKLQCASDGKEDDKTCRIQVSAKEHRVNGLSLEGQSFSFHPPSVTISSTVMVPTRGQPVRGPGLVGRPSFFCSAGTGPSTIVGANYQQKNPKSMVSGPDKIVSEPVELNGFPTTSQSTADFVAEKQVLHGPEMPASRLMELESRSRNPLHPAPFRQPDVNGLVARGLPIGEAMSNYLDKNRMVVSSMDGMPTQMVRSPIYFPHGLEQGPRDSAQLLRMLAESTQEQQKSLSGSLVDMPPVMQSDLASRKDNSSNAAANAAHARVHLGSGGFRHAAENTTSYKNHLSSDSLNNPTGELQSQVSQFQREFTISGTHFQPGKNSFPLHALMMPPVQAGKKVNSKTDQWFSLSNG